MHTRNAARVLPEPVGAAISVCPPAAISRQPPTCGSVGPAGNLRPNQALIAGWNESSTRSRYLRAPTFDRADEPRTPSKHQQSAGAPGNGSRLSGGHLPLVPGRGTVLRPVVQVAAACPRP